MKFRFYKEIILESLVENTSNDFPFEDGVIRKMSSPALYRNQNIADFVNKIDENLVEFILDIKRTQNLVRPAFKENQIK